MLGEAVSHYNTTGCKMAQALLYKKQTKKEL